MRTATEILEQIKENQVNKLFREKQKLSSIASKNILRRASFEIYVGVTNKVVPKKVVSEETVREINVENIENLLKILNEALDEAYEIEKENEQNNNCSRANSVNLLTEVSESLQSQIDIKSEELKKLGKNYSNLETLHAVSINQIDDYKKELDDCFAIFNQQKELIEEKEAQLTNNERIKQAQLEFIISCQRSIYQLNREKEELEQELDKLLENFDSEQIENDYLHKKLDDLQDLLGITEDDIENLTNLAKTLEGRTIWKLLDYISCLEGAEQEFVERLEESNVKLVQETFAKEKSQKQLKKLGKKYQRTQQRISEARTKLSESEKKWVKENSEIQQKLKTELEIVKNLSQNQEQSQKELEKNKIKLDELSQKLSETNEEKKKRGKKIRGLITESRAIKNELLTTQAEVADLETLRNNLTNAFYSKDQELITSQEQLKQVNQQVAELTAELDVVQAQRDARPTVAQLTVAQDQIQILNELLVEKNAELDEKDIEFEQLENEITSKNNENQQLANDLLTLTTERDTLVNSIREELAREREKTNNLELELVERNNHTCPIVEDKQSIEREIVKEIIDQLNLTLSEEVSVKEVITELKALIDKKPIEVPVEIEKEKIVKVENTSLTNSLKQEISELEKELSLVKSKGDLLMPITCAITIPLLLIIMVLLKKRRLVGKKR